MTLLRDPRHRLEVGVRVMGKSQTTLSWLVYGAVEGSPGPWEKSALQTAALVLLTSMSSCSKTGKGQHVSATHAVLFSVFKCICMNPRRASVMDELFPPTF